MPDPENPDIPYRDPETGYCVPSKPDEVGLLIGKIMKNDPTRRFEGYTDKKATKMKILENVFINGDSWFNSGDLLSRDYWGYFYWSDRTGDTFRYKGENVATTEVEQILTRISIRSNIIDNTDNTGDIVATVTTDNTESIDTTVATDTTVTTVATDNTDSKNRIYISDCAVYGVKVPNCDGKAGMAAIVMGEDHKMVTDEILDAIAKEVSLHLPSYSRPLFLRFDTELVTTATYKHIKAGLVSDGFDPSKVLTGSSTVSSATKVSAIPTTPKALGLYLYKSKENKYISITNELYQQIKTGDIKI